MKPLLIIDAANVVGSVPDGWWRDRRAAAERLRDRLTKIDDEADILMVVEGKAKGIQAIPGVPVFNAPGSGDDAIVELVRANEDREVIVVTADRGLRERVTRLGAQVRGPSSIRPTA